MTTSQAIPETVSQSKIVKEFYDDNGEITGLISFDTGADGTYIRFDCDCLDALPYCKAQCCALVGTRVYPHEVENFDFPLEEEDYDGSLVMRRDPDGFCHCLDKNSRQCKIYENRPETCRSFHCTRGARMRGWKLSNRVHRHSVS